jgi:hypothetical protein
LQNVQIGYSYILYAACPAAIYRQLTALLLAITRRDIGSNLGELGIRAYIEWDAYNVVFYEEPMMTWLWPTSIFFYTTEDMFLLSENGFDPSAGTGITSWEHIPGTTLWNTAMQHNVQLVTANRRALSAMHGYTAS